LHILRQCSAALSHSSSIAVVLLHYRFLIASSVFTQCVLHCALQIGTPYYMSPEIFQNKPYNHKSDVWALGIVLYELATLQHAFDAQSITSLSSKIIKGRYPPIDPMYSKNLKGLIKDLLAPTPKARPDIEQILRKAFLRKRVEQFVHDLQDNGGCKTRTVLHTALHSNSLSNV
jgi:serine/threonine protein kinase